jgi:ribosomal-protein-alanine N-acetyltransferase
MSSSDLQIIKLDSSWEEHLARFFADLMAAGDEKFFHPHPLDRDEAHRLVSYAGRDLYYVLAGSDGILAYGMLRGWDEGFEIPSLGIADHPSVRGRGYARAMVSFLHATARHRGASQIMLKTHKENHAMLALAREMGYSLRVYDDDQLLGLLDIT